MQMKCLQSGGRTFKQKYEINNETEIIYPQ